MGALAIEAYDVGAGDDEGPADEGPGKDEEGSGEGDGPGNSGAVDGLHAGGSEGRGEFADASAPPRGGELMGRDIGSGRFVEAPLELPPGPLVTSGFAGGGPEGVLRPGADGMLEAPPLATARAAAASATLEPDELPLREDVSKLEEPDPGSLDPDPLEPAEAEPVPLRAAPEPPVLTGVVADEDVGAEDDDGLSGEEVVDDAPLALAPFEPDASAAVFVLPPCDPSEPLSELDASETVGPSSVAVGAAAPAPGRESESVRALSSDGLMSHLRRSAELVAAPADTDVTVHIVEHRRCVACSVPAPV